MVRDQRAFASGTLFLAVAMLFFFASGGLSSGTLARLGAGDFPRGLCICLAVIGVVVMIGSLRPGALEERLEPWDFNVIGWIVGSVMLFGLLLKPLGLVATLALLVMCSSLASSEFTWRGALAAAVILIIICIGIFVIGLDLRLPLWPSPL